MITYAVYRKQTGEHFYNPARQNYNVSSANVDRVGGVVNDCECVYIGDLETAMQITEDANSQLSQTSIDDML